MLPTNTVTAGPATAAPKPGLGATFTPGGGGSPAAAWGAMKWGGRMGGRPTAMEPMGMGWRDEETIVNTKMDKKKFYYIKDSEKIC